MSRSHAYIGCSSLATPPILPACQCAHLKASDACSQPRSSALLAAGRLGGWSPECRSSPDAHVVSTSGSPAEQDARRISSSLRSSGSPATLQSIPASASCVPGATTTTGMWANASRAPLQHQSAIQQAHLRLPRRLQLRRRAPPSPAACAAPRPLPPPPMRRRVSSPQRRQPPGLPAASAPRCRRHPCEK
jgi:hypothetical protein